MSTINESMTFVQSVLAQQASVSRPSEAVCAAIANIKDLCDLQGAPDWRRGPGSQSQPTLHRSGSRGSLPNIRGQRSSQSSPTASPLATKTPEFTHTPHTRYQSQFKNSSQPVEDKILNNIILSKLNKFSPATYTDVRDFLYQILGSGDPDLATLVRDFIMLVFKKAASEEVYCSLYAKLLTEISSRYTIILEEMKKLQENYSEIFQDVIEIPEGGDDYSIFVEKNKEKRYRQGYSQFLAELTALEILELPTLTATFRLLMSLIKSNGSAPDKKTLIDEYGDCLVRMSRVLRKRVTPFFLTARATILKECGETLTECIDSRVPSISTKTRFLLMDVRDILLGN
jgi:hypothetical protein